MSLTSQFRRHVAEPLRAKYAGSPLLEAWEALEKSQYLAPAVLRDRQWQQLQELVARVYADNDFYRQRLDACGVTPAALRGWEDFARIPVLTKQEVRALGRGLISKGYDAASLVQAKTGGSTGKPLEIFFTEAVSEKRNASGRRSLRWSGWEVGEPRAAVWGNPHYATTMPDKLREWLFNPIMYLDTMSVSPESVRAFSRQWTRMKPTLLFGHAHSIFLLADMLRQLQIDDVRPTGIVASSMMLVPHERVVIERVFGRKVFDLYGCEEVGLIGSECERHDGMHMNVDQLIVEVITDDGRAAAPGERGVVTVTDLQNLAMPLLRYRMEDVTDARATPCPCGRGLPMMGPITGRVADFLRRRDGSRVAGISLIENSLTKMAGMDQMQIVQESLQDIRLRIVTNAEFTPARRDEVQRYFEATFEGATVAIEQVARIEPEPNGKYRFSICRVQD
jgi:phenylacetate-CoA ligase